MLSENTISLVKVIIAFADFYASIQIIVNASGNSMSVCSETTWLQSQRLIWSESRSCLKVS